MVEFLACIGTNIWQEVIGSDFQEIAFEGGEGCRRACEVRAFGGLGKNKIQAKRTLTASDGLRFL